MNLSCMLATPEMKIGDEVQLISSEAQSPQSIQSIAELANTVPYEILIRLEKGIRREIIL